MEITTEDPDTQFILLRDITLLKKLLYGLHFNKFLNLIPLKSIDEFKQIKLQKEEIKFLSNKFKVHPELINRCLAIFKYSLINNNPNMMNQFRRETKIKLYKSNRSDFEIENEFRNRKGPVIFFHDEPDFTFDVKEFMILNNPESSSILIFKI